MNEKRRHERYPDSLTMAITSAAGDIKTYVTHDVSDGGIFVLAENRQLLPIGMEVRITPTQHAHEAEQPAMRGRVARCDEHGMGIEFLDPGISQP
jgi:hypothetical protein